MRTQFIRLTGFVCAFVIGIYGSWQAVMAFAVYVLVFGIGQALEEKEEEPSEARQTD